eukprot:317024_1
MAAQQQNKFFCKYCGESFKYWHALNIHIKVHTTEPQQQSIQTQKYQQVGETEPTQQQQVVQIQKYNKVNQQPVQHVETQQPKQTTQQIVYNAGEMPNDAPVEDDDPSLLYCMAILSFCFPICGLFACCCCANNLGPRRKKACYVLTLCTILGLITGITIQISGVSNTNSDTDTNYFDTDTNY